MRFVKNDANFVYFFRSSLEYKVKNQKCQIKWNQKEIKVFSDNFDRQTS